MNPRKTLSAEHRRRISRGLLRWNQLRSEQGKVTPRDLERLRSGGKVSPGLRPLLDLAAAESLEISNALGGDLTPQRRLLLEDVAALGIAARVLLRSYLETGTDHELASRLSTVLGSRRQALNLLGLERLEREVDLASYIAERSDAQDRASGANGAGSDSQPEPTTDVQQESKQGFAGGDPVEVNV